MNVAGKPILAYILDQLKALGVEEIVLVVGYLAEKIEEYVRDCYEFRAHFVHQDEAMGNGHAVYLAREHLNRPTLIVFGDTVVKGDLRAATTLPHSAIGVHHVADPRAFGVVEVNSSGIVKHLWEKPEDPPSDLAAVGVYMIQRPAPFREALELLGDAPPAPQRIPGSVIIPPSAIAATAVVEGSVLGPYVTVADGARVTNAVIKESIINANARVDGVLLEHAIIGDNAVVTGQRARINLGDSSEIELS